MKKLKTLMVSAVLLCGIGVSNSVLANPQLAKQYKCLECHVLDKKVIGPSIRDIAQKYKGDPGAMSRLVDRVRSGSVGAWGTTPMQGHPDMPQKDIEAVVKWMLDR